MSESKWKTLSSSYVLENPWYKVRQDKVIRPDGKEGTYNVIENGESVFVIPITDDQHVLLVSLYRYTTGRTGWEIPCGGIDKGEAILDGAKRELQEETGCTSDNWEYLGDFDSMNGITDSKSHVFVARDLVQTAHNDQAEEGITTAEAFSPDQVMRLIKEGQMVDGLSIAALMKFLVTHLDMPR
jgi:8-oxo-dGTP pyrophosphatase MutT (NUDIX family)